MLERGERNERLTIKRGREGETESREAGGTRDGAHHGAKGARRAQRIKAAGSQPQRASQVCTCAFRPRVIACSSLCAEFY
jgi:hypothetical protein